jgi:hypothetical protein
LLAVTTTGVSVGSAANMEKGRAARAAARVARLQDMKLSGTDNE